MRIRMVVLMLAAVSLAACDDDPIIGPTGDDTGGGSYGVIHFNASPQEPDGRAAQPDSVKQVNPKRF